MRVESAVGIVAIAARDQTFVDLMVKGLGKVGFHFLVAGETQCGLRRLQELLLYLCGMRGVAVHAAYVVLQMLGTQKVAVLFPKLVTAQTALGRFLAGKFLEIDDVFYVG